MKLQALIVDDERIARESLNAALLENCPEIQISGLCSSAQEAKEFLSKNKVDIVFTDIQMPGTNGIDFINSISDRKFSVVFVTAFNHYAIKAIRSAAFDYLLKPVDEAELRSTIKRLIEHHNSNTKKEDDRSQPQLDELLKTLRLSKNFSKITIPHSKGYKAIDTDDILFLEGNNNYTNVHLSDGSILLSTRTMKELEAQLDPGLFYRAHKSYLINLFHFREYLTEDGGYAVMSNKFRVPVSRGKGPELLLKVKTL